MNRFNSKEITVGDNVLLVSLDYTIIPYTESPGINRDMKRLIGKTGIVTGFSGFTNCFRVNINDFVFTYHKLWLKKI